MATAPIDGAMVEFGVYKGGGLIRMGYLCRTLLGPPPLLYGFDSFEGMPRSDVPLEANLARDWREGSFGDTGIELVHNDLRRNGIQATLIKGIFRDLKPLRDYGIHRVRFAHVDCDIYEGYRDACSLLTPCVGVGTVLIFDEIVPVPDHRYQGVRVHGKRAFEEWERETGINLHLVKTYNMSAMYLVVDQEYLRRYGKTIVRLKRDTPVELLKGYVKDMLGRG